MNVVFAWLRLDLRRRWRSLTVLVLLIALSSGTIFAALAGARRGASAVARLQVHTLPTTTAVLANTPGFDWRPVAKLPEVAALTTFVVDYVWSVEGITGDPGAFPPADGQTMTTIEKPIVYKGRVFDPARADEAVVSPGFAAKYHVKIGSVWTVDLPTPDELMNEQPGANGRFNGPRVKQTIVGIVKAPWFTDTPGNSQVYVPSPGMTTKYEPYVIGDPKTSDNFVNALVRLKGGEAALPEFEADIARLTHRDDLVFLNQPENFRVIQHHVAFESRSLLAFGLAAFIAALFLVGQAIARYAAASTEELRTLRAIGMTPRQATVTAAAGPAIAGVVGVAIAVGGAWFFSRLFPIGTGKYFEPSPGRQSDWLVFGSGAAVIVVLVAVGASVAALLALSAARRETSTRRSTIAAAVARAGLPIPVVVGSRFALEAGRGRTSVPVRPAIIGAVMGVLGIVAAFTFSRGVSDAASHPERFGQTFQATAFLGLNDNDFNPPDVLINALQAKPQVTGIDRARTSVATDSASGKSISMYQHDSGPKPLATVVTSGRMPETANEVAFAPVTMKALKVKVGSHVTLTGNKAPQSYVVTGEVFVPSGSHNDYFDGGWLTANGYDSLFTGFKFDVVLVSLKPSARSLAAIGSLGASLQSGDKRLNGLQMGAPDPLPVIYEVKQVRQLPVLLGIFLALLAVGAVGHALATAVRRRSHDLAVLRALGMTQRQCRWVVVTQATVLALIGVVFGVPLGLAIGRTVWRTVADYTPLQYVPPLALSVMLLVGPAALLLANILAAWPGHRAARLRVAQILRAE